MNEIQLVKVHRLYNRDNESSNKQNGHWHALFNIEECATNMCCLSFFNLWILISLLVSWNSTWNVQMIFIIWAFFPSKLYIGEIYYFFVHYAEFFFDSTKHLSHGHFAWKKSLKIPKGLSGTVTRRTGDSMAKEKGQKDKQRSTKHDT